MKKIYLVFVTTNADGKHRATFEAIRVGENLANLFRRYDTNKTCHICHVCETATKAAYLAAEWNKDYKNNGTLEEW